MATQIQVVLQGRVEQLGYSGDVVKVRPGFARNFLYPRKLALPATGKNLAKVDELKRLAAEQVAETRRQAAELARQLQNVSVKITRAVGEENKMYGSVTGRDIEEAFAEKGLSVDRKLMVLPDPIRTLGLTEVSVKLHSDVVAVLRVEVVKQV
jgi:large subunit ribosomal protein L9